MSTQSSRREATHDRIVDVASRAVRRHGFAGVGVADVMKQAGLTHGGFYAHFDSREAMLAEAVQRAGADSAATMSEYIQARAEQGGSPLRALVEMYLAEGHLSEAECGCVVAALSSEMPRQAPVLAETGMSTVQGLVGLVQRSLPAGRGKEQAMVIAGTLVGALQLARALGPNAQGRAMLAASRKALLAQYEEAVG